MICYSLPMMRFALSNNYLNAVHNIYMYNLRQLYSCNYCGVLSNTIERYRPKVNAIERHNARNVSNVQQSNSTHNHSKIWRYERYLSVTLVAIMPVSLLLPSLPALDYALALSLVAHIHWGIEAIVVDYVRPSIFGAAIPKISIASLYLLSILSVAGLFYFNYTDVGLVNAIRMIAKL